MCKFGVSCVVGVGSGDGVEVLADDDRAGRYVGRSIIWEKALAYSSC